MKKEKNLYWKENIFYLICGFYQSNESETLIDGENILKYNIIILKEKEDI